MSKMTIHGAEYPIKKVFSDDFVFTIPLYQRAYSWTTEQSEDLLQDLLRAMDSDEELIDEIPPYFLGSIVLIKKGRTKLANHRWAAASYNAHYAFICAKGLE